MEVTLVHGTSRSVVELADGIEAPYAALLDAAADLSGSHPSDLLLFGLPFEADYGPLDVGPLPSFFFFFFFFFFFLLWFVR